MTADERAKEGRKVTYHDGGRWLIFAAIAVGAAVVVGAILGATLALLGMT